MKIATIDDFLLQHSPVEPQAVPPALLRARDSVRRAITELVAVPDSALEKTWPWRGEEVDLRYGFFRQFEAFEEARGPVGAALAGDDTTQSPARALVGLATATRWDLHGVILGVSDEDLDRVPGNGEWTIRQTLAHIVSGQRAYGWGTAWWLARRDAPVGDFPKRVPEDVIAQLPAEEIEGVGTIAEIGRRFDDIVDLSSGALGGLDDDALATRARWSGIAVDIRFRLVRWSSHIREHTIQVEKTLGFIGRPTTEVERLIRLISAAYGRLEEDVFMRPTDAGTTDPLAIVELVASEVAEAAPTIRAAA
jgi:hypothetical protein